jgi:aminoglycoside 6'-N-acetyltransferase
MAACVYTFQSMTAADLPTVRQWLAAPHVAEWWGDPDQQFALVCDDLDHPAMQQFIVAREGRPFAYLQCYDPGAWPNHGFGALPPHTRGIDQFIGDAEMTGRGHGSTLIRAFVDNLFDTGVTRVVTDPEGANTRAIRAYEMAGFRRDHPVQTPDGPALLMVRDA